MKQTRSLIAWMALGGLLGVLFVLADGPQRLQTAALAAERAKAGGKPLRVLFIGNSITFYNSMPNMIVGMANSARDPNAFEWDWSVVGGATLKDHWERKETAQKIDLGWNIVVLQEQSRVPSWPANFRDPQMMEPALNLDRRIKLKGSQTILFSSWGYQDGDPNLPTKDTYALMQRRIDQGYREASRRLNAKIAPVGTAWSKVRTEHPKISLYEADGFHPSLSGSYLAACVFYAVLYQKSPVGNAYSAGLPAADAHVLQKAAAAAVGI